MSTARSRPTDSGYAGLLMRASEFLALGETQEQYELINGVVLMSPSPRPKHWKIVEELLLQFRDYSRARGVPLDAYAEIDLLIDDVTVVRPDLCIYCRATPSPVPERLAAPPDLVVEVLSPGSKPLDLITKRDTYEHFGVKEYWTIDADDGAVRAWALRDGKYRDLTEEGNRLASAAIAGFVADLGAARRLSRP